MVSHKKGRSDAPAEAPKASETPPSPQNEAVEREQSLAHYATTVGVITGLFGMLFAIGFILLPAATTREKVLVIGASLAVSVAGLTGFGAWRSRRRFSLTVLAGGLAVVCLAVLAITVGGVVRSTPRAAGRATSHATVSAHSTSSPTQRSRLSVDHHRTSVFNGSTHGTTSDTPLDPPSETSPAVDAVYLSTLPGEPGSDQRWVGPVLSAWTMKNKEYSESLGYPNLCYKNTQIIYNLDKTYREFTAEVGIADHYSHEDMGVEAAFEVDDKIGSGTFKMLTGGNATPGADPSLLQVLIPPGTTELQLTTSVMSEACMQDSTIVWGNAQLTP